MLVIISIKANGGLVISLVLSQARSYQNEPLVNTQDRKLIIIKIVVSSCFIFKLCNTESNELLKYKRVDDLLDKIMTT